MLAVVQRVARASVRVAEEGGLRTSGEIGGLTRCFDRGRRGRPMTGQPQLLSGLPQIAALETERYQWENMCRSDGPRQGRICEYQRRRGSAGSILDHSLQHGGGTRDRRCLPRVEPGSDLFRLDTRHCPMQRLDRNWPLHRTPP